jgi:hypothetical protein
VITGEEVSKPTLTLGNKGWDYLGSVCVVLRPVVLALEEELEFGSEVGNSLLTSQHGVRPGNPESRITPVDPTLLITIADGDVETPCIVLRLPAPHVVLVCLDDQL